MQTERADPGAVPFGAAAGRRSCPTSVAVYPTHGFGSFCSATPTSGEESTIGREREINAALIEADEDTFVKELLAGLAPTRAYYAHMGPVNRGGPPPPT